MVLYLAERCSRRGKQGMIPQVELCAFKWLKRMLELFLKRLGPIYENRAGLMSQTARQTPQTVSASRDSSLSRGNDLRASRKSVTFDTNLESVAVYSPLGTPRGGSQTGMDPDMAARRVTTPQINVENLPISVARQSRFGQSGELRHDHWTTHDIYADMFKILSFHFLGDRNRHISPVPVSFKHK